jgi:ankyrin repeat protein
MNEQVRELLLRVQSTADFGYVIFDSINATNALGDNALHCVCVWGDLDAVKLLVENGIDINQRGEGGFTPLKVAVDFGFLKIAEHLIANGADPSEIDAEETFDRDKHALHLQRLGGHIDALEKQVAEECDDDAHQPAERDR